MSVRRSEKELAAQVFVASCDEEELEAGRPAAPIDALIMIVRAAKYRCIIARISNPILFAIATATSACH